MHSLDFGWAIFMKGHATMGFFSRLMGGSDEQKTAASEFEILAPVSGELVHLENTNDPAFSSRAVGDGVAVVPQEGTVCAPVSGTVAALFPTEHALGIMSDDSLVTVNTALEDAKDEAFGLGVSRGIDPFMTLSFMALPVIPSLRITTRGVFDVTTQSYV